MNARAARVAAAALAIVASVHSVDAQRHHYRRDVSWAHLPAATRWGEVTAESTTPDHSGAEGVGVDASAWSYGRVVAAWDTGLLPVPWDDALRAIKKNHDALAILLKELDIKTEWHPSA
jgi:hypothetical protein